MPLRMGYNKKKRFFNPSVIPPK
jgi:hypothetical protein